MQVNEVFPPYLRSVRITIFRLLMLLVAVSFVWSLTSTTSATRSSIATDPDIRNSNARFDFTNSNPFAVPGRARPEKKNGQDQQKSERADESQSVQQRGSQAEGDEHHDVSPPLYAIPPAPRRPGHRIHDHERLPRPSNPNRNAADPVLQRQASPALAPTTTFNFDGVGNGFTGPAGTFTVNSAPPDTNGDVGPNHYIQIVNTDFAIFNKSGTALYGPVPINTLWSGFGGGCQTNNDGDPVVVYDRAADRWVISQFSVTTTPYLQCVAVSQTSDPTGAYYRYSFSYTDFPDYPKMGVWPDAYYITFNMFAGGTTFNGGEVCAYNRSAMLTGAAATQQCFNVGTSLGGLLPADLRGSNAPPSGSPNYVVSLGSAANQLAYWKFHVDWNTPANTTLTGPSTLATANFSEACAGGTCIPQSGTSQKLDSLADRLMYRLAYRNFGDHEGLVVNHSVTAGSSTGVRWYELRPDASHNLSLFQQGTYAPDSNYRWMGSIAMDQSGNMALGFSVSGSSINPQIHYTGRLASSPAGVMDQGEGTIINGTGSQTTNLSRWGDYSMMAVDPSDDCTFWYTNEYIPSNGTFNWKTRIASFKFPGCGGPPTPDFSLSTSPTSQTIAAGSSTSYTVTITPSGGFIGSVNLSVSGLPSGAAGSFSPNPTTSTSTLSVTTTTSTPAGTYALTITGTSGTLTHTTSASLTVTSAGGGITNGGFETGDFTGWTRAGTTSISTTSHTGSYAAQVGSTSPTNGDSSISQTFTAPASGGTLTFWYQIHCPDTLTYDWANATLVDNTASTTTTMLSNTCTNSGTWVQANGAALAGGHSYTLTLLSHDDNYATDPTYTLYDDVVISAPSDFSISASPSNLSIAQGSTGTSTISTAITSGSAGTVNLTASVSPAGPTVSLNPASVAAGNSSTLTVSAGCSVAAGSYTVTVTGTEGSVSHSTSVAVTVTPTTSGFSISASPNSLSIAQGSNGTSTISTGVIGCPGTVALSAAVSPAGPTASLNPGSVTAGSSSTLTVSVGSSVTAGAYTVTVTGTEGSATHSISVSVTVTSASSNAIVNGGFETGNFTGWTRSGSTSISTRAHTGTYSAQVGSSSPFNGNSSINQTFTAPSGSPKLSFWYLVVCTDTVTYDWATATLMDNTTGTTTTVLPKTCTNNSTWFQKIVTLTGGHSYTLTLINRDDNYPGDPTYTLYDDVFIQ